jgi:hypothetical protein
MTILLFYEAYVTDVSYYLEIAKQGLLTNAKAYQDFSFSYPPLALFFTYLPARFSHLEFWSYWRMFRAQMFLIDMGLFAWAFYFLVVKIRVTDKQLALFVGTYSVLGFLQGHLLYDRLDLLVLTSLFALFYFFSVAPSRYWLLRFISLIGVFVKFVPFLYALVLNLLVHFSAKPKPLSRTCQWIELFKGGFLELFWFMAPFYLLVSCYESLIAPGLFKDMNMHFQRGIQVESTWATPVIIKQILTHPTGSYAVNNFGAQHIDETQVPFWYLELSKLAGLLALTGLGLYLFLVLLPKLSKANKSVITSPQMACLVWINIFCIFLSTQRVLSPQFFIWLMLPLGIFQAFSFDWKFLALTLSTYLLTYIGFDLGYWQFVAGSPFFVTIVAARNLLLITLTLVSLQKLAHYSR